MLGGVGRGNGMYIILLESFQTLVMSRAKRKWSWIRFLPGWGAHMMNVEMC